jgi:hypothetical protein
MEGVDPSGSVHNHVLSHGMRECVFDHAQSGMTRRFHCHSNHEPTFLSTPQIRAMLKDQRNCLHRLFYPKCAVNTEKQRTHFDKNYFDDN